MSNSRSCRTSGVSQSQDPKEDPWGNLYECSECIDSSYVINLSKFPELDRIFTVAQSTNGTIKFATVDRELHYTGLHYYKQWTT